MPGIRSASGGALGGDHPEEALRKGIHRDLLQLRQFHNHDRDLPAHGRLGHHDFYSSGKDVYVHFAAPEFAFALVQRRA